MRVLQQLSSTYSANTIMKRGSSLHSHQGILAGDAALEQVVAQQETPFLAKHNSGRVLPMQCGAVLDSLRWMPFINFTNLPLTGEEMMCIRKLTS